MIPWLLVAEQIALSGQSLADLVDAAMQAYPASGEINRRVAESQAVFAQVEEHFTSDCIGLDRTDGLSMEFLQWRFNLRSSNTEPVVRLNVESRGNQELMEEKTQEILSLLDA